MTLKYIDWFPLERILWFPSLFFFFTYLGDSHKLILWLWVNIYYEYRLRAVIEVALRLQRAQFDVHYIWCSWSGYTWGLIMAANCTAEIIHRVLCCCTNWWLFFSFSLHHFGNLKKNRTSPPLSIFSSFDACILMNSSQEPVMLGVR